MSSDEAPTPRSVDTLCARAPAPANTSSRPLVPPLELAVVYCPQDLGHVDALYDRSAQGYIYARERHPNADQLAAKIAALEGAESALVCASGMAAISAAILPLLGQGDHLLLAAELYGKTTVLVARELARLGITHTTFDAANPSDLASKITPRTRAILIETLSNPLLRVADLASIALAARAWGVPLIVDNTFAPVICRPIEQGAALVVHSATKMIGGHSDLTLGVVAGLAPLVEGARATAAAFGLTGNPFESWLALRGLATLPVRMERASRTAHLLGQRFEAEPRVRRVWYPLLDSHPDSQRAGALLSAGGSMLTIEIGGRAEVDAFMRALPSIPFAPSLGDVQTTLSHPCTTSHRGQDPQTLERLGIVPGVVRISVGLEDPEDLWREFAGALAAVERVAREGAR